MDVLCSTWEDCLTSGPLYGLRVESPQGAGGHACRDDGSEPNRRLIVHLSLITNSPELPLPSPLRIVVFARRATLCLCNPACQTTELLGAFVCLSRLHHPVSTCVDWMPAPTRNTLLGIASRPRLSGAVTAGPAHRTPPATGYSLLLPFTSASGYAAAATPSHRRRVYKPPPLQPSPALRQTTTRPFATLPRRDAQPASMAEPLGRSVARPRIEDLERAEVDDRSYRIITLSNQLEVLLIHDATTDKASAAMDVNVGSFSDAEDMPGIAHAVEHLLFMGTEKVRGCANGQTRLHRC